MEVVDRDEALAAVTEFLGELEANEHVFTSAESSYQFGFGREPGWQAARRDGSHGRLLRYQPLIEEIARAIDPHEASDRFRLSSEDAWEWTRARDAAQRLAGILAQTERRQAILGQRGPALEASSLHPWVWNAAVGLWDDGHYGSAVFEAAKVLEHRTQVKLERSSLIGSELFRKAFSPEPPRPNEPRLRLTHIESESEGPRHSKSWSAAHEGARHFGMGCAEGIRNAQAHGSDTIREQDALEQLAALSVLARWVDISEVSRAATAPDQES